MVRNAAFSRVSKVRQGCTAATEGSQEGKVRQRCYGEGEE